MTGTTSRAYRVGVDIGGTFVDVVLQDQRDGRLRAAKLLADPVDPARSALAGIDEVLALVSATPADLDQIVHATTIGPNTIIQRRGARTAFLTTEGFGDVLEIQRQHRHSPYDLSYRRYEPLVPRERVFEVPQRTRADGSAHRPLDDAAVRAVASRVAACGAEAVAVSLLHSYADPHDELRVRELLREALSEDVPVSLSSQIAPLLREYERASTVVANAYIAGAYQRYLRRMEQSLRKRGFAGSFHLMQANGGLATAAQSCENPIFALESGPTAGAIMASHYGRDAGHLDVLGFDMGGTTAKAAACVEGEIPLVTLFEVDRTLMRPGTGIPVLIPSLDLVEIGAGGGSIARAGLGVVSVGPQSAGAEPGPACYGRGGDQPTVTDANLVLGYLNPHYFNGGEMTLDLAAAREAVAKVGSPLGLDAAEAAWGVHDAVTGNMADAIRAVSLERGHDPRRFALVPSGGGGPLHAARIARAIGVPTVVVPVAAGVMSAVGLLAADPRFDLSRAAFRRLGAKAVIEIDAIVAELRVEADARLDEAGFGGLPHYEVSLEMRYAGQGHEITVPIPDDRGDDSVAVVLEAFERRYEHLYGFAAPGSPVEITMVRLTAQITAAPVVTQPAAAQAGPAVPVGERPAYFPESGGTVSTPVHRREDLAVGATLYGPAIVEEKESTTVVLPGDHVLVDEHGNLVIAVQGAHRD